MQVNGQNRYVSAVILLHISSGPQIHTMEIPDLVHVYSPVLWCHQPLGSNWGSPGLCRPHAQKHKINVSMIYARRAEFYKCLSSRSDHSRCRRHMNLTNHGYFDYGKNLKIPNLSPVPWQKWRRLWHLACISVEWTVFTSGIKQPLVPSQVQLWWDMLLKI